MLVTTSTGNAVSRRRTGRQDWGRIAPFFQDAVPGMTYDAPRDGGSRKTGGYHDGESSRIDSSGHPDDALRGRGQDDRLAVQGVRLRAASRGPGRGRHHRTRPAHARGRHDHAELVA